MNMNMNKRYNTILVLLSKKNYDKDYYAMMLTIWWIDDEIASKKITSIYVCVCKSELSK